MKINKNIPNIICFIRICLIPVILLFLLDNPLSSSFTITARIITSGVIFGIAMITDMIDGKIARKYNLISNFGIFLDPIADKLLVLGILMAFVENNFISSVPVILILAREFMVTGLRLAAAGKGNVIAANMWGKIKTTLQGASMGGIFVSVLVQSLLSDNTVMKYSEIENISLIPNILIWVCALYTIISVIPYYKASKRYIKD